jgi:hypothetical protein
VRALYPADPPGRCGLGALLLALTFALLALLGFLSPARAQKHHPAARAKPAPETKTSAKSAAKPDSKAPRSKTYTFTGLDIDGKLKTPQLLYFLNRMKAEFDTTTPEKRSFLPELKRSTDEM